MTANLSRIFNSGSVYEQLISQTIAVESQPRLKLRAEQTEQNVYKGVLSDFASKASALDKVLARLRDPLQSPFAGRAATVPDGAGFTATTTDRAAPGDHAVRVDRLARADARLSKRVDDAGTDLAGLFVEPGQPGGVLGGGTPDRTVERRFTVRVPQDGADAVALDVAYTPPAGATNDDVLAGLAAAVNAAADAARADGRLAEGTGVAASVVHETSGTARLSLRGLATGYGNRLAFDDPDGVLDALEADRTAVRQGAGGGAVYAVGTGPEDSDLSAAFELDGLALYRDSNTVTDALDGVTLVLASATDEAATLSVGADTGGMRAEIEAFVEAYNGLSSFLTTKSKVDADAGTRGPLAGDTSVRSLRSGMRADLARSVGGAGGLRGLADLGVTVERDGRLTISDGDALDAALAARPAQVGALFGGTDGLAARLEGRTRALLGAGGTIAQRKESVDARVERLGARIERWDVRLARREETLRAQFAQLQEIATQAQAQQQSIANLFFSF